MDNIMHEYTAGELLDWLKDEDINIYMEQEIEETNTGDTIVIDVLNVDKIKTQFIHHVRRYVVVKRGYKFYIHDNKTCNDIMMFKYTADNEEEIQNHANSICEDLNQHKINFIGKKYKCNW